MAKWRDPEYKNAYAEPVRHWSNVTDAQIKEYEEENRTAIEAYEAGYDAAIEWARQTGVRVPTRCMVEILLDQEVPIQIRSAEDEKMKGTLVFIPDDSAIQKKPANGGTK